MFSVVRSELEQCDLLGQNQLDDLVTHSQREGPCEITPEAEVRIVESRSLLVMIRNQSHEIGHFGNLLHVQAVCEFRQQVELERRGHDELVLRTEVLGVQGTLSARTEQPCRRIPSIEHNHWITTDFADVNVTELVLARVDVHRDRAATEAMLRCLPERRDHRQPVEENAVVAEVLQSAVIHDFDGVGRFLFHRNRPHPVEVEELQFPTRKGRTNRNHFVLEDSSRCRQIRPPVLRVREAVVQLTLDRVPAETQKVLDDPTQKVDFLFDRDDDLVAQLQITGRKIVKIVQLRESPISETDESDRGPIRFRPDLPLSNATLEKGLASTVEIHWACAVPEGMGIDPIVEPHAVTLEHFPTVLFHHFNADFHDSLSVQVVCVTSIQQNSIAYFLHNVNPLL